MIPGRQDSQRASSRSGSGGTASTRGTNASPAPLRECPRSSSLSRTGPTLTFLQSPEKLASHEKQLGSLFPDADPSYLRSLLQGQSGSHVENAANQLLFSNYPKRPPPPPVPTTKDEQRMPGSDSGLFGNLKRKLRPETRGASSMDEGSLQGLSPPNLAPAVPPRTGVRPSSTATETPTSTDAIRSNVLRAIQVRRSLACEAGLG